MKIFPPTTDFWDGRVRVSARIETQHTINSRPEEAWYEVPEQYGHFVHPNLSAFTVALLQYSMALGEDLEIAGPISRKLAYHLTRYQQIFNDWYPSLFHQIRIIPEGYEEARFTQPRDAATVFSGGVDSFFTLLAEKDAAQALPIPRLSYGIFAFFNLEHHNRERYERKAGQFESLFSELGMELIRLNTNIRQFLVGRTKGEKSRWINLTYGAELASFGHILGTGIQWLYIPSGLTINNCVPDGSKLMINHLLSTEKVEIVHHGLVESRGDKLRALAEHPESYDLLNVCWWHMDGDQACGKCPKCARTMAYLDAIGKLDRYTVFPKTGFFHRNRWFGGIGEAVFTEEIYEAARENQKWGLALTTWLGLRIAGAKKMIRSLVQVFKPNFKSWNR